MYRSFGVEIHGCMVPTLFSASSQTCQPQDQQATYVREMLRGCWTDFVREDKAEVHILNLIWVGGTPHTVGRAKTTQHAEYPLLEVGAIQMSFRAD
ncbi:hypothetical protein AMECASPLE_024643 [Ameca splendens]|uniref:TGFBR3/Endoglin-like N-terminal domain-containing protein n=1 Tax=Ameca splendens TaxID=208324 RepID=A0ABV0Y4C5_9TELE